MQKILHTILCVAVVFAVTACNVEFAPAPADSNASAVTDVPSARATKAPKKKPTQISSTDAAKAPKKKPTQTSSTDATQPAAAGDVLEADNGFRPDPNGFSFENYGNEDGITNLTPADVQRMFGDQVCTRIKKGVCTLTPAARRWMKEINSAMDGGHCEGFAVLSDMMYRGEILPKNFGASSIDKLSLEGNEALQREIAYWFTTQYTSPGADSERKDMTPVEVVDELAAQFKLQAAGKPFVSYVLGIYQSSFDGGHALTPFAIDEKEDGKVDILVYDNNYPGEIRAIQVDRKKNTWRYQASTNPKSKSSLYKGTAKSKTLTFSPMKALTQQQECPFCDEDGGGRGVGKLGAPAIEYNEIWLDGDVGLLITDAQGRRLGIVGEEMINEIPNARFTAVRSGDLWADAHEPVYRIPRGVAFTATLDGRNLPTGEMAGLTLIGPGYTLAVDGIELEGRQTDVIAFSADGRAISYKTATDLTPLLTVGIETDAADYEFEVIAEGDEDGQDITLRIDPSAAYLAISKQGNDQTSTYDLAMTRYGDEDDEEFEATGIELAADATDYIRYGEWVGAGKPLRVEFDLDNDGTMDESVDVQEK